MCEWFLHPLPLCFTTLTHSLFARPGHLDAIVDLDAIDVGLSDDESAAAPIGPLQPGMTAVEATAPLHPPLAVVGQGTRSDDSTLGGYDDLPDTFETGSVENVDVENPVACPMCTFDNDPTSACCAICASPLP